MKRKLKQSIIPPISIKLTITSHLSLNIVLKKKKLVDLGLCDSSRKDKLKLSCLLKKAVDRGTKQ